MVLWQARHRKKKSLVDDMLHCCWIGSWTWTWSTLLVCVLLASVGRRDDEIGGDELLSSLQLDGSLLFENVSSAASDFGRIRFASPRAVLYPRSVRDIQVTLRAAQRVPGLTVAAKGCAHSVHGQAQVPLPFQFTTLVCLPFNIHGVCISMLNLLLPVQAKC